MISGVQSTKLYPRVTYAPEKEIIYQPRLHMRHRCALAHDSPLHADSPVLRHLDQTPNSILSPRFLFLLFNGLPKAIISMQEILKHKRDNGQPSAFCSLLLLCAITLNTSVHARASMRSSLLGRMSDTCTIPLFCRVFGSLAWEVSVACTLHYIVSISR